MNVTVDKHHVAHTLSFKDKIETWLAMKKKKMSQSAYSMGHKYSNVTRVVNVNHLELWVDI